MGWIRIPGLAGRVYVPDDDDRFVKKHPCKTCFSCQWCDENRCRVCRQDKKVTTIISSRRCATTSYTPKGSG